MREGTKVGLQQLCKERGLRVRGRGCAVLQVMDEALDHPSVDEIYRRAVLVDPGISLATVYRTINDLTTAGFLLRLEFGDGKTRYERAGEARHDHLIDLNSGAILEFCSPEIEAAIRKAAEAMGYGLFSYRLKVLGEAKLSAPQNPDHGAGKITMFPGTKMKLTLIAIFSAMAWSYQGGFAAGMV